MESFLTRYRNITILLLVIVGQLILLAVQVKNDQDVRMIRVWTVTAVTPVARLVEWVRGGSIGFFRNYFVMREAGEENRKLREEVGRLRMENNFLKNELSTADRAKALQVFQSRSPSRTLAANVIGVGAGSNAKTVYVNRGSTEGVRRGMAVVTPDGIVGKVIGAFPVTSEVLLVTDPEFAAGVMSQNARARGTLKGQGSPICKVDYVAFEDKVEPGEWFYASGDDRIFPRGFPVGMVKSVRPGQPFKEILLEPSGLQHGLEDVLIVISVVHQDIPDTPVANQPVFISPAPPAAAEGATVAPAPSAGGTVADRLRNQYKAAGDAQGHTFGEGGPGTKPPDFTKLGNTGAAAPAATPPSAPPSKPPATAPAPASKQAQPAATPAGSQSIRTTPAPANANPSSPAGRGASVGDATRPPVTPATPTRPAPDGREAPGGDPSRPPATSPPPASSPPPGKGPGGPQP